MTTELKPSIIDANIRLYLHSDGTYNSFPETRTRAEQSVGGEELAKEVHHYVMQMSGHTDPSWESATPKFREGLIRLLALSRPTNEANEEEKAVLAIARDAVKEPQKIQEMMRKNKLQFTDLDQPAQKLAFTLYTIIVEYAARFGAQFEEMEEKGSSKKQGQGL